MPRKKTTVKQLLDRFRTDPGSLTPSQLREAQRIVRGLKKAAPSSKNDREARYRRASRASASEIGPPPPVVNPQRRESCRLDLLKFLTTYFPESTGLCPFCAEQVNAIKRIELCALKAALEAAKKAGPFVDTGNENSNGNALARIAEAYRG